MEGEDEAGYEMETSEKLSSSLPKLRERVRRWTNGQAPIPACNCDPALESGARMRATIWFHYITTECKENK